MPAQRRVLVAPDKLRGTATATEAADAIAGAVEQQGAIADRCPLSDGGEGFLDALGGPNRVTTVPDPQGRPVEIGWRLDAAVAVIDTAAVSARALADGPGPAAATSASSVGVGELLNAAITSGAERILIGLGGSAFSDGGRGALSVLPERLPPVQLVVACDVRTRYVDAARVYGPQKGADGAAIEVLTRQLAETADEVTRRYGRDPRPVDGTGAAGGLAGALYAVGGQLQSGLDIVADRVRLADRIAACDLVITAEGRLDATSLSGKVVGGLVARAGQADRPLYVLAGSVAPGVMVADATVVDLSARYGNSRAWHQTRECLAAATADLLGSG